MEKLFPRTEVAGVSLPRLLIGTNWLLGYSHRSSSNDKKIRDMYNEPEKFLPVFEAYLRYGIDALMAPVSTNPIMQEAIKYAEDKLEHKFIIIDTPAFNVDDNADARKEAEAAIRHSKEIGATFCLIHHASCEQLVNKNLRQIPRLPDYLAMIRDAGLLPGLSAHMPEIVQYCDQNDYDVETYIQIFNCMGFLMQVEIESVARIIQNAKHPVMTIKPFAAGRTTPFVGLNFNWAVLRDCDMITVGANNADEAVEDIEISLAALERRPAILAPRSSPFKQSVLGH
ncbi:MAG: hypothetical protein E7632_07335 [Ruminococcaceae bacterium]|nr:hypothetical protein [Oscillospiraceae bacterium]